MNTKKLLKITELSDKPDFVFHIPLLSLKEKLYLDWMISNNYRKNRCLLYQKDLSKEIINSKIINESIALDIQNLDQIFVLVNKDNLVPFKTSFKVRVRGALVDSFVISDEKQNLLHLCEKFKKRKIDCDIVAVRNITEYFQNAIIKYNPLGICFIKHINSRYCSEDLLKEYFFPKNCEINRIFSKIDKTNSNDNSSVFLSELCLDTTIKHGMFFARIDKERTNSDKAVLIHELSQNGENVSISVYTDIDVTDHNSYCILTVDDAYNYIRNKGENKVVSIVSDIGKNFDLGDEYFAENLTLS